MANIKISGFEQYETLLRNLEKSTEDIAKRGVYEGAKVVADAVKEQISDISSEGPSDYERKRREKQKEGLKKSLGISPMRNDNGFVNTLVGFDDYNDIKTKKHPGGQPNAMVARIFNSGTSHNKKQPFFKRAINQSKEECKNAMALEVDKCIIAIEKGGRM
ncbi:MAG: hypothetical protein IIV02_06440 [Peptococcaceae bacterium]|nr:hypothetical protein [Peptococcaceae bacterium]